MNLKDIISKEENKMLLNFLIGEENSNYLHMSITSLLSYLVDDRLENLDDYNNLL